jgi:hypothetical protein
MLRETWKTPEIEHELSELSRTSTELGVPIDSLLQGVQLGRELNIKYEQWALIHNTDSCEELSYKQAEELAVKYGRDFKGLLQAMVEGVSLPMPLVLDDPEHGLYLVGGNTRLMACRVLNILPKVLVFHAIGRT